MATNSLNGRPSLRLADYSDRELLALVRDHEDAEGWADSLALAQTIWPKYSADNPSGARAHVSVRFSWLKRWGVMVRHEKEVGKWRLTEEGRAMIESNLTGGEERSIIGLDDSKLMSLGYAISDRYQLADDVPAILLRRAWQFAQHQRRMRSIA